MSWTARADEAYDALLERFWDARRGLFRISTRRGTWPLGSWHYWWQAHALECVLDAAERGRAAETERAERLVHGVLRRNGGQIHNDYYDDMAWMGLALGRVPSAADLVATLWAEVRGGWDGEHGGIVWRRGDTYTNAPANGPSALLAARRYRAGGDPADLDWARRIAGWLDRVLVEAATGTVWDGVHPDRGQPPGHEWYSYNQGTVAAANHELAALTGEPAYAARALQVARAGLPAGGVLPDEGGADRALFKGIYARYAAGLGDPGLSAALAANGEAAWAARNPRGLFGASWEHPAGDDVELSAHLSGVLLLGALAAHPI